MELEQGTGMLERLGTILPSPADTGVPKIDDGASYEVTDADLRFLEVKANSLKRMIEGSCPLGMTERQYEDFTDGLLHALAREGVHDADVCLQGSSAHFFSGWHKPMPYTIEEVMNAFAESGKVPRIDESRDSLAKIQKRWPEHPRPSRRMFDSMKKLGIAKRSDYDVQISSDQMLGILATEFRRRGADMNLVDTRHEKYRFIKKEYTETYFLYVSQWSSDASKMLKREVSWALFSGEGPNRPSDGQDAREFSHYKPSDWIIRPGGRRSGAVE